MNITKLISDFKKNNSMLWVEANNIKLFVANEFDGRNEIIETIKKVKPEIVSYLVSNKIFSKEDFQKKTIFKSHGNEALMSFAQERLWFIELYAQGSNAYHIPLVIDLDADTDIEGMKYALQQIVWRHEVLRTTIEQAENEEHGIQRVHDEPLIIEEITLPTKQDYKSLVEQDINRPFDLSTEYPVRIKFYIIQSSETTTEPEGAQRVLLVNFHHIASDGWSIDIFKKELAAWYGAYISKDTDFGLPPLEIQYKDYALWQRSYLSGEILEKQLHYWKNKLSGYQTLELPIDYARPAEIDYRGSNCEFSFGRETSQKLRALAQQHGVTLYSVLLSSVHILLSKYSGQQDIVTGSVIANRHHLQTEGLIGFFVNTQVNRTILNRSESFADLIQQLHQDQAEAQLYQDLPFEKLVEELGVERDLSRHPVFQVMFGIENFSTEHKTTDEQKRQAEVSYDVEKFDLSINIDDSRQELMGQISYATALFRKDTIERLISHYTNLLKQLTEVPGQPYSRHSLLSAEEYQQIVYEWNDTDRDYPKEKTIYQLFEQQAEKTPDSIAVVYEGEQLSYQQLNEKSNQLARHIREQYLKRTKESLSPDTLIALYLDRSLEMVIGILAVLKAGGAYVPIDIHYPQERIDYLLQDTRSELILSQRQLTRKADAQLPPDKVIYIDLAEQFYQEEDTSNQPPYSKATDLAYVIYTSGTTGKPKGVMVEHRSVINLIDDLLRKYSIDHSEKFLLFANYVFDASVEQMYLASLSGGTLYVINNKSIVDINSFENYIAKHRITHLHSTPSFLNSIDPSKLSTLKRIVFGAEYLAKQLFDHYKIFIPTVINEYGPTEATITSLVSINSYSLNRATIQNTKAYVLDSAYHPVPVGVIGDLYLCGVGLARGYLNNPDLTAERFIDNPFSTSAGSPKEYRRLYKTGDLVRWLGDGNMEYIGRNDDQVKIRGYRIELGEIEYAMSQIPGIRQSCVLAKERETESGSTKYLVGYYVPDDSNAELTQAVITGQLLKVLPEYMVPDALIKTELFPLTVTGKLDKKALPDPNFEASEEEYVVPTSDTEAAICTIWQEVLGLERVGITDDFFRIGGNSILAIQVSHRMSKALGCDVHVADVFRLKSIQMLLDNVTVKQVDPDNVEWDILINT